MQARSNSNADKYIDAVSYYSIWKSDKRLYAWDRDTSLFNSPLTLTYSFALAENKTLYPALKERLSSSDLATSDINSYSSLNQALTRFAMSKWERVANITFIESDQSPQVEFLEARLNEKTLAYVYRNETRYQSDIEGVRFVKFYDHAYQLLDLKSSENLMAEYGTPAPTVRTIVHELGHVLRFEHPFSKKHYMGETFINSTTHSVMNYNPYENYVIYDKAGKASLGCRRYFVISPTEYDIRAAERSYGINSFTGYGNNTYSFVEIIADFKKLLPDDFYHASPLKDSITFETLLDEQGINTLSAKGIQSSVVMNLNAGIKYRSKFHFKGLKYHAALVGDFHHVIAGDGANEIYLNHLDNVVDVSESRGVCEIISGATQMGHDVILGFNPSKDQITIQYKEDEVSPEWLIKPFTNRNVAIAQQEIMIPFGVEIAFNANNTMTLAGVTFDAINEANYKTHQVSVDQYLGIEHILYNETQIAEMRADLAQDVITQHDSSPDLTDTIVKQQFLSEWENIFAKSFAGGFSSTIIIKLLSQLLEEYGLTEYTNEEALDILNLVMLMRADSWLTQGAAMLTSHAFRLYGRSRNESMVASLVVAGIVETTANYFATGDGVTTALQTTGRIFGRMGAECFTFFGRKALTKINEQLAPCDLTKIKLNL